MHSHYRTMWLRLENQKDSGVCVPKGKNMKGLSSKDIQQPQNYAN